MSPRVSATLDGALYKRVRELAVEQERTVAAMVRVLLRNAVRAWDAADAAPATKRGRA